jgi:putative ABC transport system ATP-binding protein
MHSTDGVVVENVSKRYGEGPQAVAALTEVSVHICAGEFVSIMGPSGSGKSTLLNLIAGLDTPSQGRVIVAGQNLAALSENARCALRLRHIGFVFQSFHLFPTFTAEQNVTWPLEFLGIPWRQARTRADAALAQVGLNSGARKRRPAELSGGEQQRVAIARALVTRPGLLVADEPTGNLDSKTGQAVLDLLRGLNNEERLTIILVTHSAAAAAYGHRTVELRDGCVVREEAVGQTSGPVSM